MAKNIQVREESVRKVLNNIKKYDDKTQKQLEEATSKSLSNIRRGAISRVPRGKTGNLRKGIRRSFSKKNISGAVKSTAPHSYIVEFGTKQHKVTLKKKKALSFEGQVYNYTEHPGSQPRPFMQPAFHAERPTYAAAVKKAVNPDKN